MRRSFSCRRLDLTDDVRVTLWQFPKCPFWRCTGWWPESLRNRALAVNAVKPDSDVLETAAHVPA
jgi:hypothetical protein